MLSDKITKAAFTELRITGDSFAQEPEDVWFNAESLSNWMTKLRAEALQEQNKDAADAFAYLAKDIEDKARAVIRKRR